MPTLILGDTLVDLMCRRPVASLAEADAFVPSFGGQAANLAVLAARTGADVALAGGAGEDGWGEWLRDRLAEEGVGLDDFGLLPGVATPVAFVTIDGGGEPSYHLLGEGLGESIAALAGRIEDAVDRSDAVVLSSNSLVGEGERAVTHAARDRARQTGKPVLIDPNLRLHRWRSPVQAATETRELVEDALLVKLNREEAELLSGGERDPERAAAGILARGARNVVVTLGPGGAILRGDFKADAPAPPAQVRSTVGAGDALMAELVGRLTLSRFYPATLAAALADAVVAGARATERWTAVGPE